MASEAHNLSSFDNASVPSGKGKRFAIVVSEWNDEVTCALAQGAIDTLKKHDVSEEDIVVRSVPGSYELLYASGVLARKHDEIDAVIAIGCVIRGGTPHFDYICEGVTNGLANLNIEGIKPVVFGLLTCDNQQQALDRSGGRLGNKGCECAVAALKMVQFK